MNARTAEETFTHLLAEKGLELAELKFDQGLEAMLTFYRNLRADDCPENADGDKVLYQWGMFEHDEDMSFELNLTRQLIVGGDAEDENIWQLSLTFKYAPTNELRALTAGNKWCPRPRPRAVDYFESFVRESAAYHAVATREPNKVELAYFNAG